MPQSQSNSLELAIARKEQAFEPAQKPNRHKIAMACIAFRHRISSMPASGIVFDYDGTLWDRIDRPGVLRHEVALALTDVLAAGIHIAIATGRGSSVGQEIRDAIPSKYWGQLLIGYYNGSIIQTPDQGSIPDELVETHVGRRIALAIQDAGAAKACTINLTAMQVSIAPEQGIEPQSLVPRIAEISRRISGRCHVNCSARAVDIVLNGTTKLSVVDALRKRLRNPKAPILRLGDRGRSPGNDYELLANSHGVSVDQVSDDLRSCWNPAPAGMAGVSATLHFLSRIRIASSESITANI